MHKSSNSHAILLVFCIVLSACALPAQAQPVLAVDFEDAGNPIARGLERNQHLEIVQGRGVGGGAALRATYEPYEQGSRRITGKFALPPALEYTLNYDVNFEDDFQFTRGGKLHGLGPTRPVTGGNAIRPDGWSARASFRGGSRLATYNYHQNQPGKYGQGGKTLVEDFRFAKNRWYAISLHVRVNEDPAARTGFVRLHIDGKQIQVFEDVQWRATGGDDTLITHFLFSTFHGGSTDAWTPRDEAGNPVVVHALFDNFAVHPGKNVRAEAGKDWE